MNKNIFIMLALAIHFTANGSDVQSNSHRLFNDLKQSLPESRMLNKVAVYDGGLANKRDSSIVALEANCALDEMQFLEMRRDLLDKIVDGFKTKNAKSLEKILPKTNWPTQFSKAQEKIQGISVYQWNKSTKFGSIENYLNSYKTIEHVEFNIFKYSSDLASRNSKRDMVSMNLVAYLDIRGVTSDGQRRHDRGNTQISVKKIGKSWKTSSLDLSAMKSLTKESPIFIEKTLQSGLDKLPEYQRLEAIRRGGYALATGDVNNDGFLDMYVGAFGSGKLLMGNAEGKYEEKPMGLQEETYVKTAIFADFNNDGFEDLLLVRFVPTPEGQKRNDLIIYRNNQGLGFVKSDSVKDDSITDYAMPATVADFNGDGLLDFYVGFPGAKDFTTMGKIATSNTIKTQGLYINNGNFQFEPNLLEEFSFTKQHAKTHMQKLFPHSAVSADFDQDGDMDILVIDDRDQLSPAYENDGKGKFLQVNSSIGLKNHGFGMGVAIGDLDNDSLLDIVYTNVNFNAKFRLDHSCMSNWGHEIFNARDHGLKLYKSIRPGQFADASRLLGLDYAGEGLSGSEFLDYDNDGNLDLYVTNGLWTGTNSKQDLSSWYVISSHAESARVFSGDRTKTQSTIMDILSGFKGDLNNESKILKERPHLAGYQRNRLYKNRGNGTFIEVGYLEGVDSIADGYVIAKADINGDGNLDIILRNGDPGSKDVSFLPVQVYHNQLQGAKSLRLKLISKGQKRFAIGAWVKVKVGDKILTQHLMGNNGTVQSERVVHFGLGSNERADLVQITWPGGKLTEHRNLKAGFHTIEERDVLLTKK